MKISKQPLLAERVRRPPREGWSWIDRRFLSEHAPRLERDAILLYFFLAAVSDKYGLSYYSDPAISERLRMSEGAVAKARSELEARDLIAYRSPLYQVLSLRSPNWRQDPRRAQGEPSVIADVFRMLSERRIPGRAGEGRQS